MSATTIPELDGAAGELSRARPRTVRDRSREPIDDLLARLDDQCANAVDALELAAALESDGMSDQMARVRYGFPDVFVLADHLYRRTVLKPAEPAAQPSPWRSSVGGHLLHGVLFGLPALCYPVVGAAMGSHGALIVLVVAMLTSWSLSQALSYLGHARRSRLDVDGSRRLLRAALPVMLGSLVAITLPTSLLLGQSGPALWFAIGQGGYLLGATVLLVCGADWWLAGALAPGVIVSATYLVTGRSSWSHSLAWIAIGVSLACTLGLAVLRTSRPRPAAAARRFRLRELSASWSYGAFGMLVAGMMVFPVVASRFAHGGQRIDAAALLGVLPLSLSMGIAEWRLYGYRRRIERLMRHTGSPAEFGLRAAFVLAGVVAEYLLGAALLLIGVVAVASLTGFAPQWTDTSAYLGYLVLGAGLFLALLIQSCVGAVPTLGWCAGAVVAEFAMVALLPYAPVMRVQLVVATGLALALFWLGAIILGRASRHAA